MWYYQLSLDKQNVNDELSEHFEQALSRELKRHAENIDVRSWVKVTNTLTRDYNEITHC